MSLFNLKRCSITAVAFLAFAGAASADTFRTGYFGNGFFANGPWAFGTIFTVGTDDVIVSSLGALDFGQDGFASPSIAVGIFNESTQSLLASVDVLSSDALDGDYRYSNISALTLTSGTQYRLVAVSGSDLFRVALSTYNPAFTFNGFRYSSGSNLTATYQNTFSDADGAMANFKFAVTAVPEPETYAMMLAGLGVVGAIARRRKAKQTA